MRLLSLRIAVGIVMAASVSLMVSSANAGDDRKEKWDATLAAAEKEGSLNISGPAGRLWRDELMAFQKAYPQIRISITPAASRDFWPRLMKEMEAGQHLWDLRVGGGDTQVFELAAKGELADVRQMFILPEVADENIWYGGFDHMFIDRAKKYAPTFGANANPLAYYNKKVIRPGEITSFKDLIDPRWKGKIAMVDPRGGSTAVGMAIVMQKFGPDFVRNLLSKQEPAMVNNPRQIIDWFASGRYPIVMGVPDASLQEVEAGGVKIDRGTISGLDIWNVGVCAIQVMSQRPHPNATTVFVNWLLTKEVQERVMTAVKLNSRRKDVPVVRPDIAVDWTRYKDYISGQSEDLTEAMADFKKLARTAIK